MAIISSILLWVGFLIISSAVVLLAVIGAHYGLRLIDKAEAWYKEGNNDKPKE